MNLAKRDNRTSNDSRNPVSTVHGSQQRRWMVYVNEGVTIARRAAIGEVEVAGRQTTQASSFATARVCSKRATIFHHADVIVVVWLIPTKLKVKISLSNKVHKVFKLRQTMLSFFSA